jgi:hypothetical protein
MKFILIFAVLIHRENIKKSFRSHCLLTTSCGQVDKPLRSGGVFIMLNVTQCGIFDAQGKQLKQFNSCGYLRVKHDKSYSYVHRLIAKKFIPNPENKPQVNHKNGIKNDNRVENLEWVTPQENVRHAFGSGLMNSCKGERKPSNKLTEKQVIEIRAKYIPHKYGLVKLAIEYGVRQKTIWSIIKRKKWKHLN